MNIHYKDYLRQWRLRISFLNMVGYANISTRVMLDHLFETYGNITAVDLEINFEHMRWDWDPQQPVETLFNQIQDYADYSEAGGVLIGHPQQTVCTQFNKGSSTRQSCGCNASHYEGNAPRLDLSSFVKALASSYLGRFHSYHR
jgi:hypothetical protein